MRSAAGMVVMVSLDRESYRREGPLLLGVDVILGVSSLYLA